MAIVTINNRSLNRSDTASSGQVFTATSATASDFQDSSGGQWENLTTTTISSNTAEIVFNNTHITSTHRDYCIVMSRRYCGRIFAPIIKFCIND